MAVNWFLLLTTILLFGLFSWIKRLFEQIYVWQNKEYRLDRYMANQKYGNPEFVPTFDFYLTRFLNLICAVLLLVTKDERMAILVIPFLIVLSLENIKLVKVISAKRFIRPKVSLRNILMSSMIILITLICFTFSINSFVNLTNLAASITSLNLTNAIFVLAIFTILDLLLPIIVALAALATEPLALLSRQTTINKARKYLTTFKNLKIVGITGSYGKTSTKEMLAQILNKKYKVAYTEGNMNTAVGISKSLLKTDLSKIQIFIAEMGAYRMGEIQQAVDLVKLDVAIITNIGKAHLDIFETIDKLVAAKSEILNGLKDSGTAILNADNQGSTPIAVSFKGKKLFFTFKDTKGENYLSASNIQWNDYKVTFDLSYGGKVITINTEIIGQHQIKNLLPAIGAALCLGMKLEEVAEALSTLRFESSHFKIYKGHNNVNIIDDGYNTNPEGFESALYHLKMANTNEKIIVTKGIPEIGMEIKAIYDKLAKDIINSSTALITSDPNLDHAIKVANPKFTSLLVQNTVEFNEAIKPYLNDKTTILIEGRLNPNTMKILQ